MKNIMKMAWEIARKGVKKFGGKVKEYFAAALEMAWEIVKGGNKEVEKYVGVKFHVRTKNWVFGANNIDKVFYSSEEARKYIGFDEEEFDYEMNYADPTRADSWDCKVEGVKCKIYVMKA